MKCPITLSPKNYFIFAEKDDENVLKKKGFKGVNIEKDVLIDP